LTSELMKEREKPREEEILDKGEKNFSGLLRQPFCASEPGSEEGN